MSIAETLNLIDAEIDRLKQGQRELLAGETPAPRRKRSLLQKVVSGFERLSGAVGQRRSAEVTVLASR